MSTLDYIEIRRLSFFAHHGVSQAEHELGQRFILSVQAFLNVRPAACADDYTKTVCYHKMTLFCQQFGKTHRFATLEALSHHMAIALLREFLPLQQIKLRIDKPAAAIDAQFDTVSVGVSRTREDLTV